MISFKRDQFIYINNCEILKFKSVTSNTLQHLSSLRKWLIFCTTQTFQNLYLAVTRQERKRTKKTYFSSFLIALALSHCHAALPLGTTQPISSILPCLPWTLFISLTVLFHQCPFIPCHQHLCWSPSATLFSPPPSHHFLLLLSASLPSLSSNLPTSHLTFPLSSFLFPNLLPIPILPGPFSSPSPPPC